MVIVSYKLKVIFLHIPKTGGTTIKNLLARYDKELNYKTELSMWDALLNKFDHKLIGKSTIHFNVDQQKKIIPKKFWDNYFKFAFVRNPWDLAVSEYFFLKSKNKQVCNSFNNELTKGKITRICTNQFNHLTENGKINLDFVGRF